MGQAKSTTQRKFGLLPRKEGHLTLASCELQEFPPKIFRWTDLQILELQLNHIQTIPPQISVFTQITTLNLSVNYLTSLVSDQQQNKQKKGSTTPSDNRGIFELTTLRKLNLSQNNLEEMPDDLTRLVQLKELDLSSNSFTFLPPLHTLTELEVLNVSTNVLKRLASLPPSLRSLSAARNDLRRFTPGQGGGEEAEADEESPWYMELEELDLSENKLTEFPPVLLKMSSLKTLVVSCNYISAFPPGFSQAWPSVTNLQVSFNDLENLPSEVLQMPLNRFAFRGNPFQTEKQIRVMAQQKANERGKEKEMEKETNKKEQQQQEDGKGCEEEKEEEEEDACDAKESKPVSLAIKLSMEAQQKDKRKDEVAEQESEQNEVDIITRHFAEKCGWNFNDIGATLLLLLSRKQWMPFISH